MTKLVLQLGAGVDVPFVLLVLSLNASLQEEALVCGIPESVLEVSDVREYLDVTPSVFELPPYLDVPASVVELPPNLDVPASVFEVPLNLDVAASVLELPPYLDVPSESNLDVAESVLAELTGLLFPYFVREDPESEFARLDLQLEPVLDVPLARLLA